MDVAFVRTGKWFIALQRALFTFYPDKQGITIKYKHMIKLNKARRCERRSLGGGGGGT